MKIVSCLIFWWFNATAGLDISVYYHMSSGIHTLFLIGIYFGINWKTNNYKPIIIIARSKISFYCEQFCLCIKRLSCSSNSSPVNAGNCIFKNFLGEHAPCNHHPPPPLPLHLQQEWYKSTSWTCAFGFDCFKSLFFPVGLQDERPLVFLPLHKSHMDYLLLTFVLVTRDIKVGNVIQISNKENRFIQYIV